jgi:2-desacetyl-2-hydroxyethyl bacteriochlorophyllide A dehydrogenase
MRALQVIAPGRCEVVDVPPPEPEATQVLIRVRASAICTQHELKIFHGRYAPDMWKIDYPCEPGFPGHEGAGEIIALGREVGGLSIGQLVAFTGIGGSGTHAEIIVRDAGAVVPLPENADLVAAALCEPAACVLHAFDLAGPLAGRDVAVVGLGPTGLVAVQLARLAGASSVLGLDPVPARRELAEKLGADRVLDPTAPGAASGLDLAADVVIECSGNAHSIEQSFRIARHLVVIFGVTSEPIQVNQAVWFHRELEIRNAKILGPDPMATFRRAVDLFTAGELDLACLVSHCLPLESYRDALSMLADRQALKVVLLP